MVFSFNNKTVPGVMGGAVLYCKIINTNKTLLGLQNYLLLIKFFIRTHIIKTRFSFRRFRFLPMKKNGNYDYSYCQTFPHRFIDYRPLRFQKVLSLAGLEILPFLIIIIVFRGTIKEKINFKKLKNSNFIQKSFLFSGIFLGIVFVSLITTFPFYWIDPIGQMAVQYNVAFSEEYGAITEPWIHTKKILLPFVESATIVPIIDTYYYIFSPENIPESAKNGHTFSSIPLSLFFIIGIGYLILKIKHKNLLLSEFLIISWYLCIYVFLSLTLESYNTSRHFIPIIFPMILIMSYGLCKFLKNFSFNKIKIFFILLVMFCHAITSLIFLELIYYKPDMIWIMPSIVTFRDSLSNPIVLYTGVIFILIFSYMCIKKIKLKNVNSGYNVE